jgi:ATP-dependent Zn protease
VQISARPLDEPRSSLLTFVLAFGPTLLLIGGFLWLNRRMAQSSGGPFAIGRSGVRRYKAPDDGSRIAFADVAGIDEVKAEQVVSRTVTTGAENDLRQVTDLARAMVTRFGMSPEIGLVALTGAEEGTFLESRLIGGAARSYSETTAHAIDQATSRIIDECYAKATQLLTEYRGQLDALAAALLRDESLDDAQIFAVTGLAARPATEIVASG